MRLNLIPGVTPPNLVMGPPKGAASVRFRVFIDGEAAGAAHGNDVDGQGQGTADDQRLYKLMRQRRRIVDRSFEIEFLDAAAGWTSLEYMESENRELNSIAAL
jgi:hypothetical protein